MRRIFSLLIALIILMAAAPARGQGFRVGLRVGGFFRGPVYHPYPAPWIRVDLYPRSYAVPRYHVYPRPVRRVVRRHYYYRAAGAPVRRIPVGPASSKAASPPPAPVKKGPYWRP